MSEVNLRRRSSTSAGAKGMQGKKINKHGGTGKRKL